MCVKPWPVVLLVISQNWVTVLGISYTLFSGVDGIEHVEMGKPSSIQQNSLFFACVGLVKLSKTLQCGESEWKCVDHSRCINNGDVCNSASQCDDFSDEIGCPSWDCLAGGWRCAQSWETCIWPGRVCDGTSWDCPDGSDEWAATCANWNCMAGYWKCTYDMNCLPRWMVCNGQTDCGYGSDEWIQTCADWNCVVGWTKCETDPLCIADHSMCDGNNDCYTDGSDEATVTCLEWTCTEFMWKCVDNLQCILQSRMCDGNQDCNDGSDELVKTCGCPDGEFKCADNRACIGDSDVCDGTEDCEDGSDEWIQTCGCLDGQWKCVDNYNCINDSYVCDRTNNCNDRSDEWEETCENCTKTRPWKCAGGSGCLPDSLVCNGYIDCEDRSDEWPANCQNCAVNDLWQCTDKMMCVSEAQLCDEGSDCDDGSDQWPENCQNCTINNLWKCADDMKCIAESLVCDSVGSGPDNCLDGSDESAKICCPGHEADFRCQNLQGCASVKAVCDGTNTCSDGSDEVHEICENWNCTDGYWKCEANKLCFSRTLVCNSVMDCNDGSDESGAQCCPGGSADLDVRISMVVQQHKKCVTETHIVLMHQMRQIVESGTAPRDSRNVLMTRCVSQSIVFVMVRLHVVMSQTSRTVKAITALKVKRNVLTRNNVFQRDQCVIWFWTAMMDLMNQLQNAAQKEQQSGDAMT